MGMYSHPINGVRFTNLKKKFTYKHNRHRFKSSRQGIAINLCCSIASKAKNISDNFPDQVTGCTKTTDDVNHNDKNFEEKIDIIEGDDNSNESKDDKNETNSQDKYLMETPTKDKAYANKINIEPKKDEAKNKDSPKGDKAYAILSHPEREEVKTNEEKFVEDKAYANDNKPVTKPTEDILENPPTNDNPVNNNSAHVEETKHQIVTNDKDKAYAIIINRRKVWKINAKERRRKKIKKKKKKKDI